MAQTTSIFTTPVTWTEITNSDVASLTFQNLGEGPIRVKATVGSVAPTDEQGTLVYPPNFGEVNTTLMDLFPGITGANRVFVYSVSPGHVMVSHA